MIVCYGDKDELESMKLTSKYKNKKYIHAHQNAQSLTSLSKLYYTVGPDALAG